jgi:hypothetical protein
LQRDVCMLNGTQICTPVRLNNDQIAFVHLETGVFLNVENVCAVTLECDEV